LHPPELDALVALAEDAHLDLDPLRRQRVADGAAADEGGEPEERPEQEAGGGEGGGVRGDAVAVNEGGGADSGEPAGRRGAQAQAGVSAEGFGGGIGSYDSKLRRHGFDPNIASWFRSPVRSSTVMR